MSYHPWSHHVLVRSCIGAAFQIFEIFAPPPNVNVLDAGAHDVDDAVLCFLLLVCVCDKGKGAACNQREQRARGGGEGLVIGLDGERENVPWSIHVGTTRS